MLPFQRGDFVLPEKSEVFQVRNHVPIIRLNPELVKAINAGSFWIEPDRPRLSLAEFCAIGLRDQWQGEPKDRPPQLFSAKVHPGSDIAPLVAAADLQLAILIPA